MRWEPVERALDVLRHFVPRSPLALGRLHVEVDVVHVEPRQVSAPLRYGLRLVDLEPPEAELPHPIRLLLHLRDLLDDVFRQPLLALEDVGVGVLEAVLIVVEVERGDVLVLRHRVPP
jgi:hypothetical protein